MDDEQAEETSPRFFVCIFFRSVAASRYQSNAKGCTKVIHSLTCSASEGESRVPQETIGEPTEETIATSPSQSNFNTRHLLAALDDLLSFLVFQSLYKIFWSSLRHFLNLIDESVSALGAPARRVSGVSLGVAITEQANCHKATHADNHGVKEWPGVCVNAGQCSHMSHNQNPGR